MIRLELTLDEFLDLVAMTNKAINLQRKLGEMVYPPGFEIYQSWAEMDRQTAEQYKALRQNILRQYGQQVGK